MLVKSFYFNKNFLYDRFSSVQDTELVPGAILSRTIEDFIIDSHGEPSSNIDETVVTPTGNKSQLGEDYVNVKELSTGAVFDIQRDVLLKEFDLKSKPDIQESTSTKKQREQLEVDMPVPPLQDEERKKYEKAYNKLLNLDMDAEFGSIFYGMNDEDKQYLIEKFDLKSPEDMEWFEDSSKDKDKRLYNIVYDIAAANANLKEFYKDTPVNQALDKMLEFLPEVDKKYYELQKDSALNDFYKKTYDADSINSFDIITKIYNSNTDKFSNSDFESSIRKIVEFLKKNSVNNKNYAYLLSNFDLDSFLEYSKSKMYDTIDSTYKKLKEKNPQVPSTKLYEFIIKKLQNESSKYSKQLESTGFNIGDYESYVISKDREVNRLIEQNRSDTEEQIFNELKDTVSEKFPELSSTIKNIQKDEFKRYSSYYENIGQYKDIYSKTRKILKSIDPAMTIDKLLDYYLNYVNTPMSQTAFAGIAARPIVKLAIADMIRRIVAIEEQSFEIGKTYQNMQDGSTVTVTEVIPGANPDLNIIKVKSQDGMEQQLPFKDVKDFYEKVDLPGNITV